MTQFQPKSILVTGGAGFIGSHFIRLAISKWKFSQIYNLDALTYAGSLNNLNNLPDPHRHHFIQGKIQDGELVNSILEKYTIDTIVHFAAESHVDRSIDSPLEFIQTNVVGTYQLLESARQFWLTQKKWNQDQCRFHHISTDEVYGSLELQDHPFKESTPYAPKSPYSASKASSDHLVRAYGNTYQLPFTLSNCSNNFGEYQHSEKFIPTVVRSCLLQKPIPIYGRGDNIRDWIYVEDHNQGIINILEKGRVGESYNLGGDMEKSNIDLAKFICRCMDEIAPQNKPHENLITFVEDRKGHDFRYAIDSHKMHSEKLMPTLHDFSDALKRTILFYVKIFQEKKHDI